MAVTLREIRQAVARALDDLGVYTIASTTSTITTVAELANSTTGASDRRYDSRFAYISAGFAAGTGTTVKPGGFAPSTGALTVAKFWDPTPHAGDTLELTGLFPAVSGIAGEATDYRSLVRRGLGHLAYPVHLDLTSVADQWEYSLSTYAAWLDREARFLGVADPARATGHPRRESWRRARLKLDDGTPTLQFLDRPYAVSGFTFQVVALRPAFYLVNGAESTAGPSADADTTPAALEDAVTATLAYAYEALMNRSPTRPDGRWAEKYAAQMEAARGLAAWDRTQQLQAAPAGAA